MSGHIKKIHGGVKPAGTVILSNAVGRPVNSFKQRRITKSKKVPVIKRAQLKYYDGDHKNFQND